MWRRVGKGKALAGLKPEAITTILMVAHFKTSGLEAGHPPQSPGHRIALLHGTRVPYALQQQAFLPHCTYIAGNAVVEGHRIVTSSEADPKFSWF